MSARRIVVAGGGVDGVCYLRTRDEASELRDRILAAEHVAVLGGGFIGCEVAAAAVRLGKQVTMLKALPTLLHHDLGPALGGLIADIHRGEGVDVHAGRAAGLHRRALVLVRPVRAQPARRGPPRRSRAAVIRGSVAERSFSAFRLDGDRVRSVISLNRPRDVLDTRRLLAREHSVTAAQLRDESFPLRRLTQPARAGTAQ